jgi:hypothetical protein
MTLYNIVHFLKLLYQRNDVFQTWQPSNTQGQPGNRMVPQVSPMINNHAQPLYIGQSQRMPAQQVRTDSTPYPQY